MTESVFFVWGCSENDGLETLVKPDSDNLRHYEGRECETLKRIMWWGE